MQYIDIRDMKYLVTEDEYIQTKICPPEDIVFDGFVLHKNGLLVLKAWRFFYDGASGPTLDTGDSMRGAAAHDAFYRMFRLGVLPLSYRDEADEELERICVEDGMPPERAKLWYVGVRLFAEGCAEPDGKPEFEFQYA